MKIARHTAFDFPNFSNSSSNQASADFPVALIGDFMDELVDFEGALDTTAVFLTSFAMIQKWGDFKKETPTYQIIVMIFVTHVL